jgi:hypothetical protein
MKENEWAGHVVCVRGEKKYIQGLGGETQKKETTWHT